MEVIEFQLSYFKSWKMMLWKCQHIWKTQQWPQDWKRSVFIPISKKVCAKEFSNYLTITLTLHTSRVMLKNSPRHPSAVCELWLPDVQVGFTKGKEIRDQIASIHWIIEKAREFPKDNYFYFISYVKAFNCVDHNKLGKILKEMGIPYNLTCLLRNLYASQVVTVRAGHGTPDWSKSGEE